MLGEGPKVSPPATFEVTVLMAAPEGVKRLATAAAIAEAGGPKDPIALGEDKVLLILATTVAGRFVLLARPPLLLL